MNLTRTHFGVNFRGVLGTVPVHQKASVLGALALEQTSVFCLVPFAQDDSLNALRLPKLCFLSCMLNGVKLDPGSFLARQLHSATVSTKGRIVIGGIVTTIARFLEVEPNPEDSISGFE